MLSRGCNPEDVIDTVSSVSRKTPLSLEEVIDNTFHARVGQALPFWEGHLGDDVSAMLKLPGSALMPMHIAVLVHQAGVADPF